MSEGRALPDRVRREVADALGVDPGSLRPSRVSGGCISPAARVESGAGTVFVKWATSHTPPDQFECEAEALRVIAGTQTVRVPAVVSVSPRALVLEWIEPGHVGDGGWRALGHALARMHRAGAQGFGAPRDNYIGPLPQQNGWLDDWTEFYRERRLLPQLERAFSAGAFDASQRRVLNSFIESLDTILRDAADRGPSLLHGDLWSGNAHPSADGHVALIDPASYYGDREVDLAMTELFGGFPRIFYDAYAEEWPTPPGSERRRSAYRVYYLLVHVNLFGGSYVSGTIEAARASMSG